MIDRQLEKNFQNTFVTATTVRSQLITVEALLLELVRRMFGEQFDLAGQHSGAADPVFLYAVETALSLSIATAQRKARSLT